MRKSVTVELSADDRESLLAMSGIGAVHRSRFGGRKWYCSWQAGLGRQRRKLLANTPNAPLSDQFDRRLSERMLAAQSGAIL
jgi:hypothetical protein